MKNGISVNHLKLASFSIDGLYLKLDKKLILKADRVFIPANRNKQPLPNLEKGLDRFNEILRYFEYIELKEVNFKNDHYSILYTDNIFYMVNDLFEVATHQILRAGDELQAIIDLIYIKEYDIRFSGKLVYNYKRDTALVKGKAEYMDIYADFMINKRQKNLYYTMKSADFSQLKSLISHFTLSNNISTWITDKVKAESYKLQSLKGAARINGNSIRLIPGTISGEALLKNVSIDFKEGLDPVKSDEMKVLFADGNLYFEFLKPSYHNKSLAGSTLSIINLLNTKPSMLKLKIRSDSMLDAEVLKIVHTYGIKLPLIQKSGSTDSELNIDIDLKTEKTVCDCNFKLHKGEVAIGGAVLPVISGKVHVKNRTVKLSDIVINSTNYHTKIKGNIDLVKKLANLSLSVNSFYIGERKKPFLSMKNTKFPMRIDFRKDTIFTLPKFKIEIKISKNGSKVMELKDISVLKKYLKNLPITVNGGHIKITSKDFKKYRFNGLLKRNDCFIYKNALSCLTQIPISGTFSLQNFILKAFQGNFVFNADKSLITLKHLNLDLKKYFDNSGSSSGGHIGQKIKISAMNSTLRYGKSKLVTDQYSLDILLGGDFYFRGKLGEDRVTVAMKRGNLKIKASGISDKMLHPLINFSGLQRGRYSFDMSGVPERKMSGVITVKNGIMSDFKAYNNVLAVINTIPALATLNSPGFSRKGFVIKEGVIKFTMSNGKLLTFDSVLIKGTSATISGEGTVNIETQKIDIDLAIQTAKVVGKIIGSIPIVGYILTGKDKSIMTVGFHIGGTLEKPITRTSPVKDVLMIPFKMIERTLSPNRNVK